MSHRLALRPWSLDDVKAVTRLIGDPDVAAPLLNVPYPYHEEDAVQFISSREPLYYSRASAEFAITLRSSGELVGGAGVRFDPVNHRAELGYWIARPCWGKGYATEAARALIEWTFKERSVNRIFAQHILTNAASGRVMQKAGMQFEGVLRQDARKGTKYYDMAYYGVLRSEWESKETKNEERK